MRRLIALSMLALVVLGTPDWAGASPKTYGPSWGRFTVAFPSSPKTTRTGPALQDSVPPGGQAVAYSVSRDTNLFILSAPVPPAPSYLVVVAKVPTQADVSAFVQQASSLPNVTLTGVHSLPTYTSIFRESNAFNPKSRVTNPNAYEGIAAVAKNKTVFLIEVIAKTQSSARTFLSTFRPS